MASHERGPANASLRVAALVCAVAAFLLAGCDLLDRQQGGGTRRTHFEDSFVAAKVNGRPITNEDVRIFAVRNGLLRDGEELNTDSDVFHVALDELITQRLFAIDAESRGLDRDPDVRRALEAARERILADAVYAEIDRRATDPRTVERLYRENARQLGRTAEAQIRHILFDTREAALSAKRRLDEGERFEALAFELSKDRETAGEGGEWGWRDSDSLPDGLREAVDSAQVGDIVGPVQSSAGWHLLHIEDRRQRGVASIAALRERIVEWARWDETNKLREKLEATARIELSAEAPAGVAGGGGVEAPADRPDGSGARRPSERSREPPAFPLGPGAVAGGAGEDGAAEPSNDDESEQET
jgi:peptidyl-prolyl cis-trans isomerase C